MGMGVHESLRHAVWYWDAGDEATPEWRTRFRDFEEEGWSVVAATYIAHSEQTLFVWAKD